MNESVCLNCGRTIQSQYGRENYKRHTAACKSSEVTMKVDIHSPVTPSYRRTPSVPAENGYICYLPWPERHTNRATSHAGWGPTPKDAALAAQYWANQAPFAVIVRMDRAPRWAREEAEEAAKQCPETSTMP